MRETDSARQRRRMHTHIASMQTNYKTENLTKLPKVGEKKTEGEKAFSKDGEAHNHDGAKTILVAFESLQKIAATDSQNDCKVRERKREGREDEMRAHKKSTRLSVVLDARSCATLGYNARRAVSSSFEIHRRVSVRGHRDLTVGSSLESVFIYPHFNYFNLLTFFCDIYQTPWYVQAGFKKKNKSK